MKTLIKPWKGLKRRSDRAQYGGASRCENPNKTLEGIKTLPYFIEKILLLIGENPNKTLEGIKTTNCSKSRLLIRRENPNKTLEGIKTRRISGIPVSLAAP
ncbi:hypothetical protein U27_01413 [Candidatus Vecturithrix granuli]|uniref:Uncharacterized protein n=1 Tax=Vecturithrix granuli TaxID=1499967 RepID=A0A081CAA7_VECG1|nr:hypothetical protein U27_01413 [Candidatus Vecturithrix granuli]